MIVPSVAGADIVHALNVPVGDWRKVNLTQGCAYARDPRSGREYVFVAQAQSGGARDVQDSLYHRHLLVGDSLQYLDTMVGRKFGHSQNFHVRISVKGKTWIWGSIERYTASRQVGVRPARFPYLANRTITTATHGFTYIEGLKGNTLSVVSSPASVGPGRITIRRAAAATETYTEYLERDLLASNPRPLRSFTRLRGSGTYQSSCATASAVFVLKGSTTQRHRVYQHNWTSRVASVRDVTNLKAPTGPNTSSEPEGITVIRGVLHIGLRFNSTARRLYSLFALSSPTPARRSLMSVHHPSKTVSPKVVASTIAAFLIPGALASLQYLQDNTELYGGLPPVLAVAISAIIPALVVFLSGYAKNDPARVAVTDDGDAVGGLYDGKGSVVHEPKRVAEPGTSPGED